MATYLVTNDEPLEIYPSFGAFFCASELEGLVDGRFHILGLEDKGVLVINADYYAIGYIKNEEATKLARGFIPDDMWIAGPALHISHDDFKPITNVDDLPEALQEYMKEESYAYSLLCK